MSTDWDCGQGLMPLFGSFAEQQMTKSLNNKFSQCDLSAPPALSKQSAIFCSHEIGWVSEDICCTFKVLALPSVIECADFDVVMLAL